jgi:hypothetical protein
MQFHASRCFLQTDAQLSPSINLIKLVMSFRIPENKVPELESNQIYGDRISEWLDSG